MTIFLIVLHCSCCWLISLDRRPHKLKLVDGSSFKYNALVLASAARPGRPCRCRKYALVVAFCGVAACLHPFFP